MCWALTANVTRRPTWPERPWFAVINPFLSLTLRSLYFSDPGVMLCALTVTDWQVDHLKPSAVLLRRLKVLAIVSLLCICFEACIWGGQVHHWVLVLHHCGLEHFYSTSNMANTFVMVSITLVFLLGCLSVATEPVGERHLAFAVITWVFFYNASIATSLASIVAAHFTSLFVLNRVPGQ